jgi:hypothetical protein
MSYYRKPTDSKNKLWSFWALLKCSVVCVRTGVGQSVNWLLTSFLMGLMYSRHGGFSLCHMGQLWETPCLLCSGYERNCFYMGCDCQLMHWHDIYGAGEFTSFNTSDIPIGIKCHWVIHEVVYLLGGRFCVCVCKIHGNFCTFIWKFMD